MRSDFNQKANIYVSYMRYKEKHKSGDDYVGGERILTAEGLFKM